MKKFTRLLCTLLMLCTVGVANAAQEVLTLNFDNANVDGENNCHLLWQGRKLLGTVRIYKVVITNTTTSQAWTYDYSTYESYPWYRMGQPEGSSFDLAKGAIQIDNNSDAGNPWDLQPFIADQFTMVSGNSYKVDITYTSTGTGDVNFTMGTWGKSVAKYGQHIEANEVAKEIVWLNVARNSYCENEDATNFVGKDGDAGGAYSTNFVDGKGVGGTKGIVVKSVDNAANGWDTQFFITLPRKFYTGESFRLKFSYRADKEASAGTQSHCAPGDYIFYSAIGNINFTKEWKTFDSKVTVGKNMCTKDNGNGEVVGFQTIAFNLNDNTTLANNYYFDNIFIYLDEEDATYDDKALAAEIAAAGGGGENDPNVDPMRVAQAKERLSVAIDDAKAVNTNGASNYRLNILTNTISQAETLMDINEATVSWINNMIDRLESASDNLLESDPQPYQYEPAPVTYKGVKKDLKAAVDAALATLQANQNKPEAKQNALATLIDQGNTILANDYSKMDQEEFEEMVNTVINRIKAAEEALKNAKEATEEPEPVIANGTYYIYNAATGLYLGAGDSWGTHAVVNKNGLDYQVTNVNGKCTLNSQVSNGGQNYFLNGEWNDGASFEWTIQETAPGSGIYTLSNGSQFAVAKGNTNNARVELQADGSSAEAQWQFITPEQRLAKAQEQFATASEENPVDLSFLIKDGDFGRNDLRKSYWNVTFNDSWGFNISGGNNNNNNAECYHHVFAIQQSVQVPDGKYMLKAQGFYRQDGSDNVNLPVFYANDETCVFPLKTTSENSMSDASVSFSAGKFEIEPIILDVVGGELSIGCKLDNNTNLWCIWDNFRLYYIGTASADLYEPAYYALLDEAKSIYEGNKNTMGAKTKSALENAINKEVNVENTSELIAGIDALKAAIAAAKEEIAANEAQMKALAAELKKAIDNAEALYNIEAYQVNRESFGELIAAAKQILDKNANTVNTYVYYIDELKDASAKFMAANKPVVEPGKVFIKNVASGKWLGAGNNWGTQASLNEHPDYVTLVMPSGLYNIESQVSNGGQSYYFRDQDGLFMDQTPATNLTIEKKDGNYLISSEKGFYGYDGTSVLAGGLAATDANAQWQIYSEKDMNDMLNAASVAEPVDATWLITDAKFGRNNRNVEAWQVGGNCTNKALTGGNSNKYGAESFHSTFDIYQSLNVPNGVYAFGAQGFYRQDGADEENLPVFYVNDETVTFPLKTGSENSMADAANSFDAGSYAIDPIYVEVTDGILRVGSRLENNTSIWAIWANYSLTYYGADASIDAVKNSSVFTDLAKLIKEGEALLDQVEVDKVKNALNKAIEAGKAAKSLDDCNAAMADLKEAVAAAEGSVKAKDVLPKMKELVEMNNIATAEALEEYYGQWVTKYQEGTITKAEASALQDPTALTGWHASLTCDDYLLSAWDAEPDFQSPYYINTWSVEGDKDGTNFHVPFIEYWTGDDSSLGEKTMTAAIDGVPAGKYTVEAWVRVRMKNSGSAPTYGISMQANGSNPVDVCDGEESTDGSSTFFNKVYQIPVTIGADGALTVSFDIASDNNVSWLAIKNVRYFDPNATGIKTVGTQKAAGQIFNLQGQRVNKATKGVFIQDGKIILKK
jgi:hypothetical protein